MARTENDQSEVTSVNPPPPPPLPDCLFSHNLLQSAKPSNDFQKYEVISLEKAIRRVVEADSFLYETPFYSCYTHTQSQLQEGPKCGLVALSIATSTTDSFKSADELYNEALNQGYTTQGEMYDCHNLADLAKRVTPFMSVVIEGGLNTHLGCIFCCIQNGGLMLVPYDADCNHSPCCRGGRRAHWAVISGIVVFKYKEGAAEDDDGGLILMGGLQSKCDCLERETGFSRQERQGVRVITDGGRTYVVKTRENTSGTGRVFLAGKQGKSLHLALWPMDALCESNWNLTALSEQQEMKDFTLPEGGVSAGLRGKAVLLMARQQSNYR